MKVIHVNLQKDWRGGEQQLAYLLQSLRLKKVEQILICRENSSLEEFAKKENIEYKSINNKLFNKLGNLIMLYNLIKSRGIDIIHCHESKGHSLALFTKIFFNYNSKIILHRRVIFPIKGFLSKKIKYSSKFINEIICVSKAVEKSVKNSTGYKNTIVIPDMIDTNFIYENKKFLNANYRISDKILIGYIAALTFEKDHFTFLNTAKLLLKKNHNLHFVIIGDGDNRQKLTQYALDLQISENVTFTGFIENAKKIIPEIDILLFTSTEEGLGSTILDFFLAKKPVVCVKNGGSEDIVFNHKTGFICEKGDSDALANNVDFILKNPIITKEIVENAYNFVNEKFSIEVVTNQTLNCYSRNIPVEK